MADTPLSPFDAAMARYSGAGEMALPELPAGADPFNGKFHYTGVGELSSNLYDSPTPLRDQKAMSVEEQTLAKAIRLGTKEDVARMAVSRRYGNDAGAGMQLIEDAFQMSPRDFELTYGAELASNRGKLLEAYGDTYRVERMDRSTGELLGDTALGVAKGAGNMVGSAATLGAQVGDAVLGSQMAPTVAGWNQAANELLDGFKSSRSQQQQKLYQTRSGLNQQDNEAQFEADLADGMGQAEATARYLGRGFKEGAATLWDSPGALFDTSVESLGSLFAVGKAAQAIGKAQATKAIIQRLGSKATKEVIAKELASKTGRNLINKEAMKAVSKITAATEGGSAINQAQQEILGMSEEDLSESSDYLTLRQTMSHEDAQIELASKAGNLAGLSGAFIGFLSGYMGRAFEVAPLKLSPKGTGLANSAASFGKNIAIETGEEIVQEGLANQMSANLGIRSTGIDKNLWSGVGEAAGTAAVSAAMSTGAIQSPALAGAALRTGGKAVASSFDAAMEARERGIAENQADTAGVGSAALQEAVDRASALAGQLAINQTTPEQSEAPQTTSQQTVSDQVEPTQAQDTQAQDTQTESSDTNTLAQNIMQDFILPDEEAQSYVDGSGSIMEQTYQKNGMLTRADELNAYMEGFKQAASPQEKLLYASAILTSSDKVAKHASDENANYAAALPETHPDRQVFGALLDALVPVQSSPVFTEAQKIITEATEASLREVMDFTDVDAGKLDTPAAQVALEALATVSRYSPEVVVDDKYNVVMNQMEASGNPRQVQQAKSMRSAHVLAKQLEAGTKTKEQIVEEQKKANAALPEAAQGKAGNRLYRPRQEVKTDIWTRGNQNNSGLSFIQHNAKITENFSTGKIEAGKAALEELGNFAKSLSNKIEAMNTSSRTGGNRQAYEAYSPENGWFWTTEAKDMPYANPKYTNSKATAQDAYVDAQVAANLYNTLRSTYADVLGNFGELVTVPELNQDLFFTPDQSTPMQMLTQEYNAGMAQDGVQIVQEATAEANAPAPKKERKLRSDAILKPNESLMEEERSSVGERILKKNTPKPRPYVRKDPLKKPFLRALLETGVTLDPNGKAGAELLALGIRKADLPGLFKEGGAKEVDNLEYIVGSYMAEVLPDDGTGNYYDRDAVLNALIEEAGGSPVQDAAEMALTDNGRPVREDQVSEPDTDTRTSETKPKQTTPEKLSDWFPKLIKDTTGTNVFQSAFKTRPGEHLLLQQENPAAYLREELDAEAIEGLSEEAIGALAVLTNKGQKNGIQDITQAVQNAAQKVMSAKRKNGTVLELLQDPESGAQEYENLLALHFAVEKEDGSYELDPRVVQAAVMATVEWATQFNTSNAGLWNDSDIREAFNIPAKIEIPAQLRHVVREGTNLQTALRAIEMRTQRMLGVSPDRSQPSNQTQGLFKALASSVLDVFVERGILTAPQTYYVDRTGNKSLVSLILNKEHGYTKILDALKTAPDAFSKAFADEVEPTRYINEAPKAAPRTKKENKLDDLSAKERKAIEYKQNIPHKLNMPMHALLGSLGEKNTLLLQGWKDLSKLQLNEQHAESLKGKNASLEYGMRSLDGWVAAMQQATYNAEEAMDLEDVEVFFAYEVSTVGRMFQQGPGTPQANKLIRELLTATNSTLDLNQKENVDLIWLAAAQAAGISIEKKADHAASISEAKALFGEQLKPAMDVLKDWAQNGMVELAPEAQQTLIDTLNQPGVENSMKLVHALVTVARMETAGANERTAFATSLAIEADGVTDGPINAMVHMGTGEEGLLSENELRNLAKGGLYFTTDPVSLNDYKKLDSVDLYQTAADKFKARLVASMQSSGNEKQHETIRILSALLPDFFWSEDEQDVERSVTKNPLTVFTYGSGTDGISSKIIGSALDAFYETLSDVAQQLKDGAISKWQDHELFVNNPGLAADMKSLLEVDLAVVMKNPTKFKLPTAAYTAFVEQVTEHFSDHMIDAIDEVLGGLKQNMELLQRASQVQAVLFQDAFEKAFAARDSELRATGKLKKNQRMSEKDMLEVFKETMALAPIYNIESQSFHIVGSEKRDSGSDSKPISSSLSGKLSARLDMTSPGEAGVKASPYLTIGTGDGRMVLNIYVDADGSVSTSLPVFDGIELSLDKASVGSEYINKTVIESWLEGNNFQSVLDSYEASLRVFGTKISTLSKQNQDALRRALGLRFKDPITNADLTEVRDNLLRKSMYLQARKNAFKRMGISSDHMAGMMAPSVKAGIEGSLKGVPYSIPAAFSAVNSVISEELDKLRTQYKLDRDVPAIQPATDGLQHLIDAVGEYHEDVKLYSMEGRFIDAFVNEVNEFSSEQEKLFWKLLKKDGAYKDNTFYFGSSEALTRMRNAIAPQHKGEPPVQAGQYLPGANVVLISNASPETMLHEVLHVHTARRLIDYYADPVNARTHVREAVQRLEGLMDEALALDLSREPKNVQQAMAALKATLEAAQTAPSHTKAIQMSEFLSWMLTNQHLIDLGKKTKTYSPLQKIKAKVMHDLKKFLKLSFYKGDDLFTNIRFNTEILIREIDQASLSQESAEVQALFDQIHPASDNLQRLEQGFLNKLKLFLDTKEQDLPANLANDLRLQRAQELMVTANEAAERAVTAGYAMNDREMSAFRAIHAAMHSGMQIDSVLAQEMEKAYRAAMRGLTDTSLFDGSFGQANGGHVATFFALSLVHEGFKQELSEISGERQDRKNPEDTKIDLLVKKLSGKLQDLLIRSVDPGLKADKSVQEKLEALAGAILSEKEQRRSWAAAQAATRPVGAVVDTLDELGAKGIKKASKAIVGSLQNKNGKLAKGVSFIARMADTDMDSATGEALLAMVNQSERWDTLRRLMVDLVGSTDRTRPLVALINKAKASIDQMRQEYREVVPAAFEEAFSRKLKKQEWEYLGQGIAKIDLSALNKDAAYALAKNPETVGSMIRAAEERIQAQAASDPDLYMRKAKELAEYMITHETTSDNLLKNADAIAAALNERVSDRTPVTNDFRDNIDKLASLYAFEMLEQDVKDTLKSLAETEETGVKQLIGYHLSTKAIARDQQARSGNWDVARFNAFKGYMPELVPAGHKMIIELDRDAGALLNAGYVRVGTYTPDAAEGVVGRMGIYRTSVGDKGIFNQGIAQNVHKTFMGADVRNGRSMTIYTSGTIYGDDAKTITQRKANSRARNRSTRGTKLIPVFNKKGKVIGYDRQIPAEFSQTLQKDQRIHHMMGVWSGRLFEEQMAGKVNDDLLDSLKSMYDSRTKTEETSFINVADSTDPVIKDAWESLGKDIKDKAEAVFGEKDFFPVRKDLVEDVIGFRSASLVDPFTGVTRWNPAVTDAAYKVSRMIMGDKAFRNLKYADTGIRTAVSLVKTNIIVRSVVVTVGNTLSNISHLLMVGVPLSSMIKGFRTKKLELDTYIRNRETIIRKTVELAALPETGAKANQIKAELRSLERENRRLSIWSLIEAGEFSTISEGLTEADQALIDGKFGEYIERLVDRMPDAAKMLTKNFFVTKDTELFKALNRSVQYGDFLAKAILQEHLEKKGTPQAEIQQRISEEFVNYNRQAGRGRDALESFGLLWFWSYKLRIMKVAWSAARRNPFSSLLFGAGVGPALDVDTVFAGSLAGNIADGSIGYSLGYEMGLNGLTANPFEAMIGEAF